jgi:hypothetical protein
MRIWREGGAIVAPREGRLPNRCVLCNAPAAGHLRREYTWHPPEQYLWLFAGVLPYLLLTSDVRKRARIEVGLCGRHREERRRAMVVGWAGCGVLFAAIVGATLTQAWSVIPYCLLAMVPFATIGTVRASVGRVLKIDDRRIWLRVGQPFVDSLPERRAR